MHLIADFLIRGIIGTRLYNDYLGSLTNTPSNSTITRLFNDYGGTERRNPPKTHKTPPQNYSAAGFVYEPEQPKSPISSGFGV